MNSDGSYFFLLGGIDLEMLEIVQLLDEHKIGYRNKNLSWGAKASDYATEISHLSKDSKIPVLVELGLDIEIPDKAIIIDHHNERVNDPSSLRQTFNLLRLPSSKWTRWMDLVEMNDVAHVEGMKKIGASVEELSRIRAADRSAQGITHQQDIIGLQSLRKAEIIGSLCVVRLNHSKMATVTDPLAIDPEFANLPRSLLVFTPREVGYFGSADAVTSLVKNIPGGWSGGNPPQSAYWGCETKDKKANTFSEGMVLDIIRPLH